MAPHLEGLHQLAHLQTLKINSCPNISDNAMEHIGQLPSLTMLDVSACSRLTRGAFLKLSNSKTTSPAAATLTHLDCSACPDIFTKRKEEDDVLLKDVFLRFVSLQKLNLTATKLQSGHLEDIVCGCGTLQKNLTELRIGSMNFTTTESLKALAKLRVLERLDLSGSHLHETSIAAEIRNTFLTPLAPTLTTLVLDYCASVVDDPFLFQIGGLMNLEVLSLYRCSEVSDVGLKPLVDLKHLKTIRLVFSRKISDDIVEDLEKNGKTVHIF